MKKLFIIIPLTLFMSYAMSQNPVREFKAENASLLDGKSFKITLISSRFNDRNSGGSDDSNVHVNSNTNVKEYHTTMNPVSDKPELEVKDLDDQTTIFSFENGVIHSMLLSSINMDNCPYNISNLKNTSYIIGVGEPIAFKANCLSTDPTKEKGSDIEGTIDGTIIKGEFIMKLSNGKSVSYLFSGTEIDSKDLGLK